MKNLIIFLGITILGNIPIWAQNTFLEVESSDYQYSKMQIGANLLGSQGGFLSAAHHIVSFRDIVLNVDRTNIQSLGRTRAFSIRLQDDSNFISRGESLLIGDIYGNVGIGNFDLGSTQNPKSKLHIKDGYIYLEDIDSGVIMKSENGNCWRMQIDNSGQIIVTPVLCP